MLSDHSRPESSMGVLWLDTASMGVLWLDTAIAKRLDASIGHQFPKTNTESRLHARQAGLIWRVEPQHSHTGRHRSQKRQSI